MGSRGFKLRQGVVGLAAALAIALIVVAPGGGTARRPAASAPTVTFAIASTIGGPGSDPGKLNEPIDVTLDNSGNVVVPDSGNNRVEKFTPNGQLLWSVGKSDNSAGSGPGQFDTPKDAAVAPDNSIWVADAGNNRVVKLSSGGGFLAAYNVGFAPQAISIAPDGSVYLSNSVNFRLEKMNSAGQLVGGWSTGGSRSFDPIDVSYASGFVYAADAKYGSNDVPGIDKFTPNGTLVKFWGKEGEKLGQFKLPNGVSASGNNVYVVDKELDRLYQFDAEGNLQASFGTGLKSPSGLFARGDDLVVADTDNSRIVRLVKAFAPANGAFCAADSLECKLGQDGVPFAAVPRGHRVDVTFVNPSDICKRLGRGASLKKDAFYDGKSYPVASTAAGFQVTIPAAQIASSSLIVVSKCPPASAGFGPAQFTQDTATETWGNTTLYDPSGFVRDAKTHKPIFGATVTLQASPSFSGPFGFADPATIRPTINPQVTDRRGHYGWDVPGGYYRITVKRFGYQTLKASRVVHVPPQVTNLNVTLKANPAEQRRLIQASGAVGPVKLGMSVTNARRAAGRVHGRIKLVFRSGRLVRIVVSSAAFRTDLGVGVGTTETNLRFAYGLVLKRSNKTYRLGRITFVVRGANGSTGHVSLVQIGR